MWDTNRDHVGAGRFHFDKLSDLGRAVGAADKAGRGFKFAYCGEPSPDAFEIFAGIAWAILDGNKATYILIEEYSDCCRGAGLLSQKNDFNHRRLWTQGRKYYGIIHATSQRPQLISKDALGNAGIFWASSMDMAASKRVGAEIDVHHDDLRRCNVGEFYYRNNGSQAEKIKVFTPI